MAMVLWVCLLWLQGCLLTHALDCTDTQVTEVKVEDESLSSLLRIRRQAQPHHTAQVHNRPGTYSVKGSPNTLIQVTQADRSRGHLKASKKKTYRSRSGSFSLLNLNHATNPLKVMSVQKHFEGDTHLKMAALKSVKKRSRRSAPKRNKQARMKTCS